MNSGGLCGAIKLIQKSKLCGGGCGGGIPIAANFGKKVQDLWYQMLKNFQHFSLSMLIIRTLIDNMLVTIRMKKQSDLGLHGLSRHFCHTTSI